jgi:hypothetical protein
LNTWGLCQLFARPAWNTVPYDTMGGSFQLDEKQNLFLLDMQIAIISLSACQESKAARPPLVPPRPFRAASRPTPATAGPRDSIRLRRTAYAGVQGARGCATSSFTRWDMG